MSIVAVMIGVAYGATVIAVDTSPLALAKVLLSDLAREFGQRCSLKELANFFLGHVAG